MKTRENEKMMASRPVLASGEECEVHRMGPGFKEIMDEESDLCVSDWELFCKNFYFFSEVFDFLVKVVGRSSPPASCSPSNPSPWTSGRDGSGGRCGCGCGRRTTPPPISKRRRTNTNAELTARQGGRYLKKWCSARSPKDLLPLNTTNHRTPTHTSRQDVQEMRDPNHFSDVLLSIEIDT